MNSKKGKWIQKRHQIVRDVVSITFAAWAKRKYRIKITKFDKPKDQPYLILYNHQTAFDQFFVGAAFKEHLYYVATEDIFSMGLLSKLIKFLVAPIPIKKQLADPRAVINCIKIAKEGGSIAIAPEGNRTYSGKTEYIKPSIVGLAKHLGLPIAIFRIEGGYGVHPRWSNKVRKGGMRAGVSKVIYPSAYRDMSDDELYEIICRELYNNEAKADKEYRTKNPAEYLERAIYVCPDCGLSTFLSHGDKIECTGCKKQVKYLFTKELKGVGFDFPFRFVNDWYEYQSNYVNNLDLLSMDDKPLYTESITLKEVVLYRRKNTLEKRAEITLYPNKISVKGKSNSYLFEFDNVNAVSVLGKNKLNVYYGSKVYQIEGDVHFCALKYINLYYRYINIMSGEENNEFLGL